MQKRLGYAFTLLFVVNSSFASQAGCGTSRTDELRNIYKENLQALSMPKVKNNIARTRTLLQHVSFVKTLDEAGALCTPSDYIYAAAITGLGISIQDNLRTIRYAATAKSLAPEAIDAARLYAASIDMLLVRMNANQLFGTQFGGTTDRPTKVPMLDDVLPKDEVARLGVNSPNDSPFVQPLEIYKSSSN